MIIHVVQTGETVDMIANSYGISVVRLMQDNGLDPEKSLIPGQALIIVYPEEIYIVKEGDNLASIAEAYQITIRQLLRNNPFLSDRQFIYPGEELTIRYNNNKGRLFINGFANSFINRKILRKTLPYLTYLSIFGNRITGEAEIIRVDDTEVVEIAREYGVAPVLFLSTLTAEGTGSQEASYKILYSEELSNKFIQNILSILQENKYYGINIIFQFINPENVQIYTNFTAKLTDVIHKAGYFVFITFSPRKTYDTNNEIFEKNDYSEIGKLVDGVQFMSFNFGYSFSPPAPVVSVSMLQDLADFAVSIISPEKLGLGLSVIGYDWKLPFVAGVTKANSLSVNSAIDLAGDVGAVIEFDEISQTPFYNYTDISLPIDHIVWFIDARTVNSVADLVPSFGMGGINIWNIMYYYHQLWVIINSQYEIEIIT